MRIIIFYLFKKSSLITIGMIFTIIIGYFYGVDNVFNKIGFYCKKFEITGSKNIHKSDVVHLINPKGKSVFGYDIYKISQHIKDNISWVENVDIHILLPDTIKIHITEKKPYAIYIMDEKKYTIDRQGAILDEYNINHKLESKITLMGKNANKEFAILANTLNKFPQITDMITTAKYISDRRWNIILQNKITIKLPETSDEKKIGRLYKILNNYSNLFSNKIKTIDLRFQNKIIIEKRKYKTPNDLVPRGRIELPTQGFSVLCSTD